MRSRVAIDFHLHFYGMYDPERFFAALLGNLSVAGAPWRLALLTEAPGCDAFSRWAAPSAPAPPGFRFGATAEPYSLSVARGAEEAFVVAGRQIVTAERLEVLSAGAIPPLADGRPLGDVLDGLAAAGALAIVPWGAGKWLGRRGRRVREAALRSEAPLFFLADNPSRPAFWPAPRAFQDMARRGRPVLRGSDPLPLVEEEERAGAFASLLEGEFDPRRPLASLKRMLEQGGPVRDLGRRDAPAAFLRRQLGLRLQKMGKRETAAGN
ncbi:MAG: hypothetical protein JXO51_07995 [Candidatus Aminicenantes bacterium]|nr:hypothetical protein [Candidatus Aminicenantes bacterium]